MDIHINKTCRTCLNNSDYGTSIFELLDPNEIKYSEMLASCSGIDVSSDDGYPSKLCQLCVVELPIAWKFVKMCKASDVVLQKYYKDKKCDSTVNDNVDVKLEIKVEFSPSSIKSEIMDDDSMDFDGKSEINDEDFTEIHKHITPKKSKNRINLTKSSTKKAPSKRKLLKRQKKIAELEFSTFKCPGCDFITEKQCRLKKHVKMNHADLLDQLNDFPCTTCGKHFKRKRDLVVHARIHSGEKPFACNYCPMRFAQSGTLNEHERNHTGETPYACKFCPRVFSSGSSFWRHRRVHTNERPYSCELCGKTFSLSSTLKHHKLVHTDERPHICSVCGKTAKSKYYLRLHMRVHSEKGFICEQCGKKFSKKPTLQNHITKMHSDVAGQCTLCKKQTSNLVEHMITHTSESPYQCRICSRKFKLKNSLSLHITLHNNADKYKCTVEGCKKAFPKVNMLDFHTRKVHSNETSHVCRYCAKGFFRINDLSRHVNSLHSDEINK